jgi:glycerophosphoryl diester phosphodiesterase
MIGVWEESRNNAPVARILLPTILALCLTGCATSFDLEGHRGTRGLAPENTLPAFARAMAIGVDTLELDTGITRDGVVVVSHNTSLNPDITRGPDGRWIAKAGPPIHSLTFEELSRYDVGRIDPASRYARQFPDQASIDGTHMPRLSDLFAMVREKGDRDVRFNIETKISPLAPDETVGPETFTRKVIAEIRAGGMARRATLQSFDWRTLAIAQEIAPGIPTVYLSSQQKWGDTICTGTAAGSPTVDPAQCGDSPWTAGVQLRSAGSVPRMVKAAGGAIWSPYYLDIDEAKVKESHALGIAVVVWTVNDPAQMKRMVEMGVDGLITDRPDLWGQSP